jgi:hypothetical protein
MEVAGDFPLGAGSLTGPGYKGAQLGGQCGGSHWGTQEVLKGADADAAGKAENVFASSAMPSADAYHVGGKQGL